MKSYIISIKIKINLSFISYNSLIYNIYLINYMGNSVACSTKRKDPKRHDK